MRDKLTPDYRIGEKRVLMDSRFYPALSPPHVELVTDPVDQVTDDGIRTVEGRHRRADVIVWATGFHAPEFPRGIDVRAGIPLDAPDRRTAQLHPGDSNPSLKEHQVRYITNCLALTARLGAPVAVTPTAMAGYRRWLDASPARTVWPDGVPSWFKRGSDGPVANPWPAGGREFARRLDAHDQAAAFTPVPVQVAT